MYHARLHRPKSEQRCHRFFNSLPQSAKSVLTPISEPSPSFSRGATIHFAQLCTSSESNGRNSSGKHGHGMSPASRRALAYHPAKYSAFGRWRSACVFIFYYCLLCCFFMFFILLLLFVFIFLFFLCFFCFCVIFGVPLCKALASRTTAVPLGRGAKTDVCEVVSSSFSVVYQAVLKL